MLELMTICPSPDVLSPRSVSLVWDFLMVYSKYKTFCCHEGNH